MAEEKKKTDYQLQLYMGPLVGVLVLIFALTKAYDRAELVSYDWRFNIRNNLFGMPPMDPRLGTIDMDAKSIEVEGRYQDWTRDKYTDVVRILSEYGAHTVAFDIFFIEPSTRFVAESEVKKLRSIDSQSVMELFARSDYDEMFRQTIEAAGNVYLGQTIVVEQEEISTAEMDKKMVALSADKEDALEIIRQRSPKLMVDPEESTLKRGFDFDPPLKKLREAANGFAYAQTETDVDGARRRYPLVYQYKDVVLPSIALLVACEQLQVAVTDVEVWPGEYIRLPGAQVAPGQIEDLDIPIDAHGDINVNWAGRWKESFVHYPHIGLRWAAARELEQRPLEKIKELVAENPQIVRSRKKLMAAIAEAGFTDPRAVQQQMVTWAGAMQIEAAVRQDKTLESTAFWHSKKVENPTQEQLDMFELIKLNNEIADLLAAKPESSEAEVLAALPGRGVEDMRQSLHYVRSQMVDGQLRKDKRPLFFYPYIGYAGRLFTPEEMQGKVLFYGLTAPGTTDLSVIPFEGSYPMVGIYPNVLNTILQRNFIRRIPGWMNALLIMGLSVVMSLIVARLKVLQGALVIAAFVLVYAVVALISFSHGGVWLEVIGPMMVLVGGYLASTIYGYVIKEKEKEFVQGAFGHYLSPAVVDQIMNNPDMVGQLGGEERVMTAFFSDIASFSTLSECLEPAELVEFINGYLSEMCDIIEHYGGTIDKFEGDAIVAFFGAPVYYEDHATRATLACIDQQKKLIELRQRWEQDETLPPALRALRARWEAERRTFAQVRMGITAGPMIVGNMGSKGRTDYTMMGDTVNLAARFESGQKFYGTNIMINDMIYEEVKDLVETRKLDLIQVMGKEEPVVAYEVLERKGELSQEKYQVLALYEKGIAAYDVFDFTTAQGFFEQALEIDPDDGPAALYADRCEDYAENPPADLVFRAESK